MHTPATRAEVISIVLRVFDEYAGAGVAQAIAAAAVGAYVVALHKIPTRPAARHVDAALAVGRDDIARTLSGPSNGIALRVFDEYAGPRVA